MRRAIIFRTGRKFARRNVCVVVYEWKSEVCVCVRARSGFKSAMCTTRVLQLARAYFSFTSYRLSRVNGEVDSLPPRDISTRARARFHPTLSSTHRLPFFVFFVVCFVLPSRGKSTDLFKRRSRRVVRRLRGKSRSTNLSLSHSRLHSDCSLFQFSVFYPT